MDRELTWTAVKSHVQDAYEKAKEMGDAAGTEKCEASRGWLEPFLKRHGLLSRRKANISQRLPDALLLKVAALGLYDTFIKKEMPRVMILPALATWMRLAAGWICRHPPLLKKWVVKRYQLHRLNTKKSM